MQFLLKDRYQLEAVIGQGAFSVVYKARDTHQMGYLCAVKEMDISRVPREEKSLTYELFLREAQMLQNISHPGIPEFFDFFIDGDKMYLITEFIEGKNLEEIIEDENKPLAEEKAVNVIIQLLDILHYLHKECPVGKVVYRDVKPHNIMIDKKDRVMLVDLATARVYKQDQEKDTIQLGTPGYAAPEAYGGKQTDETCDVYSVGVTLWRLLTAGEPGEFMFNFPPVSSLNPQVSPVLDSLVGECLKPQKDRIKTIADLKNRFIIYKLLKHSANKVKFNITFSFLLSSLEGLLYSRRFLNRKTLVTLLAVSFLLNYLPFIPGAINSVSNLTKDKVTLLQKMEEENNEKIIVLFQGINKFLYYNNRLPNSLDEVNSRFYSKTISGDFLKKMEYRGVAFNDRCIMYLRDKDSHKGIIVTNRADIVLSSYTWDIRTISGEEKKSLDTIMVFYKIYESNEFKNLVLKDKVPDLLMNLAEKPVLPSYQPLKTRAINDILTTAHRRNSTDHIEFILYIYIEMLDRDKFLSYADDKDIENMADEYVKTAKNCLLPEDFSEFMEGKERYYSQSNDQKYRIFQRIQDRIRKDY